MNKKKLNKYYKMYPTNYYNFLLDYLQFGIFQILFEQWDKKSPGQFFEVTNKAQWSTIKNF